MVTRCERCSAVIYETSLHCRRCRGINQHEAVRSWEEVAEAMVARDGVRVSRQRMTSIADAAIRKLRRAMLADPVIREWVEARGLLRHGDDEDTDRIGVASSRDGARRDRRNTERRGDA